LHVAAAFGAPWFELIRDRPGEIPWPAQIAVTEPLDIGSDGMIALPPGEGFGAVLDDEFIERYTVGRWEFVRPE
jgi:D-galactarolactone cycloisomerase